jgi:hypothetical protein
MPVPFTLIASGSQPAGPPPDGGGTGCQHVCGGVSALASCLVQLGPTAGWVRHEGRCAATQPRPRAGVEVALERWKGDIAKMRYLAGNPEAVPKRVALAASKEVLWTLGQAIEGKIAGAWRPLLPPDRIWDTLASMADHKMTGQQLERLYRTMKEQGYTLPLVKALPDDQVPSGEGRSAVCARLLRARQVCVQSSVAGC